MKRVVAALLPVLLLAVMALPALADGGPADILKQLSDQEQAQMTAPTVTQLNTMTTATIPDTATIESEIALEEGTTEKDQYANYEAKLEAEVAQAPTEFTALAKLGIAYQLDGKPDKARDSLEKAVALEPGAQSLYDTLAQALSTQNAGVVVYVGGQSLTSDVPAAVINGRTLVPMRAITEKLGATVQWNQATGTATVQLGPDEIVVTKDSDVAMVNGQQVTLAVAATIVNGRFMLPLRFLGESVGKQVDFHPGVSGTAVISIVDK